MQIEDIRQLDEVYKRLANTRRFNTIPCISSESVASHSFFVTYIAMILCDRINFCRDNREWEWTKIDLDVERIMRIALLHDVEESMSGDILATMKAESEDLNDELNKVNLKIMQRIFPNNQEYVEYWLAFSDAEDNEGILARLADHISLVCYSGNEIKMGNREMEKAFGEGMKRVRGLIVQHFPELSNLPGLLEEYYERS